MAERVPVVDRALELIAHGRRRHLLDEQPPILGLTFRRTRGDAQESIVFAGRFGFERLIDDVAGLQIEIVRQRYAEVSDLQAVEIEQV